MYSLKKRSGEVPVQTLASYKPAFSGKRRRQLRPFLFQMGPAALMITGVLLVGLMAVLYLGQLGQAAVSNQQLQAIRSEQSRLQRENQDLSQAIAIERSPAYLADHAKKAGMVPVDTKRVTVIKIQNLQPLHDYEQDQ